ncbi:Acetyl cholinesterase [Fasciola hepatica]|uniref:Acetyl cholinesterase n=1 Tax=Fasciola hepatica TaxID=6192 RepID=A0A4E0RQY0_FASHE|nr:Acetyl cholinesterase [Fasciola hepatica]
MSIYAVTCVCFLAWSRVTFGDNIIVRTNYGPISGTQKYILGKNVYHFLGVPYAQPPIGDLRFKYPRKPRPWKNILNSTQHPKSCIQPSPESHEFKNSATRMWLTRSEMSEDCLYLNIWTRASNLTVLEDNIPMLESSALFGPKGGRPVMVWIHGGSLTRGAISLEVYNGAYLASMMDVVVVSIQYRLGPFGFLYLGTEDAPGNQGLMDQAAALEWVRENIAYFGGNPQQVTLFGHAGGVICVALHLLSPVTKSLFQQAILQSGSPLAWWAIEGPKSALEKAQLLTQLSGCVVSERSATYLSELASCLRSVSASSLELNQWQMQMLRSRINSTRRVQLEAIYQKRFSPHLLQSAGYYYDIPFKPVVSAPLLPQWPYEILASGKLDIRHRIMLGVNQDEGMYHLINSLRSYFMQNAQWPSMPRQFDYDVSMLDPMDLLAFYIMDENFLHPVLLQATVFEYQIPSRALGKFGWRASEVLEALNQVGGDYNIKCPVVEFADFYSRGTSAQASLDNYVFLYSFEHRTVAFSWPEWTGVMQGFEAEYIFGAPFNPDFQREFYNFTDEEKRLSEEMMRCWTNFASTGSPNLNPGEFHTRNKKLYWERYQTQSASNGQIPVNKRGLQIASEPLADSSRMHMVFTLPHSHMSQNLRRHHCMFWREQLPLMREHIVTRPKCSTSGSPKGMVLPSGPMPDQSNAPTGKAGTFYPTKSRKPGSSSSRSRRLTSPAQIILLLSVVCLWAAS